MGRDLSLIPRLSISQVRCLDEGPQDDQGNSAVMRLENKDHVFHPNQNVHAYACSSLSFVLIGACSTQKCIIIVIIVGSSSFLAMPARYFSLVISLPDCIDQARHPGAGGAPEPP